MKKVLHEGKFKRFIDHNGWEYTERTLGSGVVAIIARTNENKILFVEQFRVPVGKYVIELPAGIANDINPAAEESLEDAAKRELLEETGYESRKITCIAEGPASSASVTDIITLFYAEELTRISAGGGDETEQITVHEVNYENVNEWLMSMKNDTRLIDPKVFAGLYLLEQFSKNGKKDKRQP